VPGTPLAFWLAVTGSSGFDRSSASSAVMILVVDATGSSSSAFSAYITRPLAQSISTLARAITSSGPPSAAAIAAGCITRIRTSSQKKKTRMSSPPGGGSAMGMRAAT